MRRAALLAALACCGAPAAAPVGAPPPRPRATRVPIHEGGVYVRGGWASDPVEVEGGVWRLVLGGVRAEVRSGEVVTLGRAGEALSGAAALPASSGVRHRYLAWDSRTLHRAERWDGPLERVGTLPADIQRVVPWFGAQAVVLTSGGAFLYGPDEDAQPRAFAVPGVVALERAGERSALALTALGRARYTDDGGKTFRDLSGELPGPRHVEALGEALRVRLASGAERYVRAGKITDDLGGYEPPSRPRERAPIEGWDERIQGSLADALVRGGVLLEDGRALALGSDRFAWVKLPAWRKPGDPTLPTRVLESHRLPDGLGGCDGLLTKDGPVLVCSTGDVATLVDVGGAPRVEVTFPLDRDGPHDLGTFVAVPGETVGFLGRCDGGRGVVDAEDDDRWDPYDNRSGQRTGSFCVRAGRQRWIQHDAPSGDRADVHAWVPEVTGDATVVVMRRRRTTSAAELPYETTGRLHVMRVAGRRPPMRFASYGSNERLSMDVRVLPGGDVDGLFPSEGGQPGQALGTLHKDGSFVPRALPPSTEGVVLAGAVGIATTADRRAFETLDGGATWDEIERVSLGPWTRFSSCSALGCSSNDVVRLGWRRPIEPSKRLGPEQARAEAQLDRESQQGRWSRFRFSRPIGTVSCAFEGPASGARGTDMWNAFGVPKHTTPQGQPMKIGMSGAMLVPVQWGPRGQRTISGDAEFSWIELFDAAAPIHRATVPGSSFGNDSFRRWEVPLGHALAENGRVDPFAVGSDESCQAVALDAVGITRPVGGCVTDAGAWSGTVGPTGVDVGSRLFVVSAASGKLVVTRVEGATGAPKSRGAPARGKADEKEKPAKKGPKGPAPSASAPPPVPPSPFGPPGGPTASGPPPPLVSVVARPSGVSRRQLASIPLPSWQPNQGITLGAGARRGAPYVVLLDAAGSASAASIDPETGRLGPDEELAPLGGLLAGSSPKCAPSPDDLRAIVSVAHHVGLEPGSLPGVIQPSTLGLAVLRWSKTRVCLDAFDVSVRDDRYESDYLQVHESAQNLRKVSARLDGKAGGALSGALVVIGPGIEVRQRVVCR